MSEMCVTCGLPMDLCVCESIAKETQKIEIKTVKRKFGKIHTIIEGFDEKDINVKEIAKTLKAKFACGGTSKDNKIDLHGNHAKKVKTVLVSLGFKPERIEIEK